MTLPSTFIILSSLAAFFVSAAQDITTIPTIPSDSSESGLGLGGAGDNGDTMPAEDSLPGFNFDDASEPSSGSGINSNAVCCNVGMGDTCPSGLNAIDGTLIGAGGMMMTSCCPAPYNNMDSDDPSCDDDFAVGGDTVPATNDNSEVNAPSSSNNGECSAELQSKFPTCPTCVYSCGDEEKQCATGFSSCSTNCFTGELVYCTVPGAASNGGGVDMNDPFDNMNSSSNIVNISVAFGVVWAIGYGIMHYN